MKYVVLSPTRKIICFDHKDQVAEYCGEEERTDIDAYCKDQEFEYENMSSDDIGNIYAVIGAEQGVCHIYETDYVLSEMKESGVESYLIEQTREIFNNRRLNEEIDCPGYLSDVLMELSPTHVSELLGPIYMMGNIDGHATEGNE